MSLFSATPLDRAKKCLDLARKGLIEVQNQCTLAKANLEDSGRVTQSVAVEMICESARQLEKDLAKWAELIQKTRENGNGN